MAFWVFFVAGAFRGSPLFFAPGSPSLMLVWMLLSYLGPGFLLLVWGLLIPRVQDVLCPGCGNVATIPIPRRRARPAK